MKKCCGIIPGGAVRGSGARLRHSKPDLITGSTVAFGYIEADKVLTNT